LTTGSNCKHRNGC